MVPQKINIGLPALSLLGIEPKELKTGAHTNTCTCVFIAALFITAEIWKQPKYPSTNEWITNCSIHMKYYSALKKNEVLIYTTVQVDLEILC